jgi:hypothetical protein
MIALDSGAKGLLPGAAVLPRPPAHIIDDDLDRQWYHGGYSIALYFLPAFAGQ